MSILDFRIFTSLFLVLIIGITTLSFFLRKKPIIKMINLAFIYTLSIIFLMYLLIIKNSEDTLFPIFIIIFINFILTFLTGVSIVKNLMKEDRYQDIDEYTYSEELDSGVRK